MVKKDLGVREYNPYTKEYQNRMVTLQNQPERISTLYRIMIWFRLYLLFPVFDVYDKENDSQQNTQTAGHNVGDPQEWVLATKPRCVG